MWTMKGEVTGSPDLKARVICNPASSGGSHEPEELHRELEGYDLEWITTGSPGDATEAAREWREGLLIVVGGDGTISEVVNGLGRAGFPEGVTLAILPAGTGNDLAETLTIPDDPEEAEAVLRQNRVRTLDVVRVLSEGIGEQFFINVAPGGRGGEDFRPRRRRDEDSVGETGVPACLARGSARLRRKGGHADAGRCGAQPSRGQSSDWQLSIRRQRLARSP